jgi:hypothetical protein
MESLYFRVERGMKSFAHALASWRRKPLTLIFISVLLLGCQSTTFAPIGHTVPENRWIFLSQAGDQSGTWRTEDLILVYKYDRYESHLNISGTIRFANRITGNYGFIQYFHVDAIPVDAQGKVLDMISLTTAGDLNSMYDGPVDFSKILTLPPSTAAMAFSYRGRAYGSGSYFDGGFMDFWDYPVY